jgi:flagellum-specific peptidoglycan hydrolase FlgJ
MKIQPKHIIISLIITLVLIYIFRKPIKKTAMETGAQIKKFVVSKTVLKPFNDKFLAMAQEAERATKVPALVTMAQAGLESGWGKSAPNFNFFGHKAQSNFTGEKQLLRTSEILPSQDRSKYNFPEVISIEPYKDSSGKQRKNAKGENLFRWLVRDWFRSYPSAKDAFIQHGKFLQNNKRYSKAFSTTTPEDFAKEVAKAGYATDPNYADKLLNLISSFKNL